VPARGLLRGRVDRSVAVRGWEYVRLKPAAALRSSLRVLVAARVRITPRHPPATVGEHRRLRGPFNGTDPWSPNASTIDCRRPAVIPSAPAAVGAPSGRLKTALIASLKLHGVPGYG
jgi:hypothetical protein